jgi:superfamily II DNA or RNA helicase
MDIAIKTPIKAIVKNITQEEVTTLSKALSYTNTSVSFQLNKLYKNRWMKQRDPIGHQEKIEELTSKVKGCLLHYENGDYWIRPGTIPHIEMYGVNVRNEVIYPELSPLRWKVKPSFEPFNYQSESVRLLIKAKHGNVSLPTGAGKSHILLLLAQQMGLNVVIVTPSQSIFTELLTQFQAHLGTNMVGGYGDGYKDIKKKVTIAIGKSLTMLKKGTEAYAFFENKQAMMVDESHTFGAEQLNDVCHGVLADIPYRMFVSATQTRNDGTEKLLASIIGENVLTMEIKEAIDHGYLCPLKFTIVSTTSPSSKFIKDPTECKRTHFLRNPRIAEMAAKIANGCWELKKQSTLILVEELEQIEMLQKLLKVPFAYVHSADKKKAKEFNLEKVDLQDSVDMFNKGKVRVLIGTRAISTGTNLYPTHNLINWTGGASEIVTKQGSMGRATRRLEISKYKDLHSPKPYAMIFDFNVRGESILEKQLLKRIAFYEESGGEIRHY